MIYFLTSMGLHFQGPLGRRDTDGYLQHSILSSTAFQQLPEDTKEIIRRVLASVTTHRLSQTIFLQQGIDFIQRLSKLNNR